MLYPPLLVRNRSGILIGCLFVACACGASGFARASEAASHRRSAIVEAVSAARPAVVNIHGRKTVPAEYDTQGAVDAGHQVNGMGTGILIDPRGYILTNYHVVEGVKRIRATLADGTTAVADLVANDPTTDLAIIKIPEDKPFPVIRVGTSSDVMPGETVVAVGNAYGYEHTVTQGIISALHRSVQVSDYQKYNDLIQTDASINPGNSGGPLLNIDGDMIGINVAVRVGAQGIGFAIPVNEAMEVAADLMSCERISRVSYGAELETDYSDQGSVVLVKVTADGGPARQAGLQTGDIIRTVAGAEVTRRLDVECALLDREAGDEVAFAIDRNGKEVTCQVVLAQAETAEESATDLAWSQLGVRLVPIPAATFRKYNSRYRGGLKIAAVREESPAEKHGLRRGDVLVGMHKWETISEDNVAYILNSAEFKATQPFRFYILRSGETLFGNMRLSDEK
ncbi:MAG: trypsin-like peptidase domain-containing protein [Pirellulaceae bacterium]|jgi:serine protease Do|nr:trypsin-like peptidase domain-containing protein [Pirellulaceae bacterium]